MRVLNIYLLKHISSQLFPTILTPYLHPLQYCCLGELGHSDPKRETTQINSDDADLRLLQSRVLIMVFFYSSSSSFSFSVSGSLFH